MVEARKCSEQALKVFVFGLFLDADQEGIYYKWASVKMTLKFHFLWSTLF